MSSSRGLDPPHDNRVKHPKHTAQSPAYTPRTPRPRPTGGTWSSTCAPIHYGPGQGGHRRTNPGGGPQHRIKPSLNGQHRSTEQGHDADKPEREHAAQKARPK